MKKLVFLVFGLLSVALSAQSSQSEYLVRDSLANDERFQKRVGIAMLNVAYQMLEDTTARGQWPYALNIVSEPKSPFLVGGMAYSVAREIDLKLVEDAEILRIVKETAFLTLSDALGEKSGRQRSERPKKSASQKK
jgi:hypothetical protein